MAADDLVMEDLWASTAVGMALYFQNIPFLAPESYIFVEGFHIYLDNCYIF